MQDKAAQVGFQWDEMSEVWAKLNEEINELQNEVESGNVKAAEKEFGDVLFSMINLARYLNIDPENALESTNQKFKHRFEYIERHATKDLSEMSLEEMDVLWDQAKQITNEN